MICICKQYLNTYYKRLTFNQVLVFKALFNISYTFSFVVIPAQSTTQQPHFLFLLPSSYLYTYPLLGVDLPDCGCGVDFPDVVAAWAPASIFNLLAAGSSLDPACRLPVQGKQSQIKFELQFRSTFWSIFSWQTIRRTLAHVRTSGRDLLQKEQITWSLLLALIQSQDMTLFSARDLENSLPQQKKLCSQRQICFPTSGSEQLRN